MSPSKAVFNVIAVLREKNVTRNQDYTIYESNINQKMHTIIDMYKMYVIFETPIYVSAKDLPSLGFFL